MHDSTAPSLGTAHSATPPHSPSSFARPFPSAALHSPWLIKHVSQHRSHATPTSRNCAPHRCDADLCCFVYPLSTQLSTYLRQSSIPSSCPSSDHCAAPSSAASPVQSSCLSASLPSSTRYFAHMDDFEHDGSLSYEKAMLAGASAGVMEHLAMFPIDTIKTNMQVQSASFSLASTAPPVASAVSASSSPATPHPNLATARPDSFPSLLHTARSIIQQQGLLRLYRGVTAVVIGAIPSHAVNYATYEWAKHQLGGDQPGHHVLANAMAGSLATMAHDAVITPLDVVKQRLQVVDSRYSGVLQCVRSIIREEGMGAFYASYPTTVLMNVPFMAVHFAGYESFKLLLTGQDRAGEHGVGEELLAGGMAGACAGLVSTPLDVVKTRIQTQRRVAGIRSSSAMDVMRDIWRQEGARGFMRGGSARVLYFMPSAAICWTTYETVKRMLKDAW